MAPDPGAADAGRAPQLQVDGSAAARHTFVFAHGAGAPMDSPFMAEVAAALAARGVRVVRFEFPYMAARRSGRRRPPDRQPVLLATWRAVVAAVAADAQARTRVAIGGKSMGGRMASMVADELGVGALVCMGYPFHPPGKPRQLRTAHLAGLQTPALILQGERDPFGSRAEVGGYDLAPAISVSWVADGDHGFSPRRASGRTTAGNLAVVVAETAAFLAEVLP